jgi:hypothetical protein
MRFRVLLRLDPTEPKQGLWGRLWRPSPNPERVIDRTVIDEIQKLTDSFYGPCNNISDIRALQQVVIRHTQLRIKHTWDRVKQGEPFFKAVRTALILILAVLVGVWVLAGAAAAIAFRSWTPAQIQAAPAQTPPAVGGQQESP